MQAIILAAGKSSRLGDITKDTPKSLLDISGKCPLARQIENLEYAGVYKITIVTGFQHEKIKQYLADNSHSWYPQLSINLIYNADWATTNNAYSLNLALQDAHDDILVLNADVVCYKDLIKEIVECPYKNAMAVVRKKQLNEEDMKVTVENGVVTYVAKTLSIESSYGEFTGIFSLEENLIPELKAQLELAIEVNINAWFEHALVNLCLAEYMELIDVSHFPYIEIDFPEDLETARDRFHYDLPVWEQGRRQESIKQGKRNIEDAFDLIDDFISILNKYNIRYWLNWGLLLGMVREGQPLQYDTDCDICIDKANEMELWEKVVPEMRKLRCFVPLLRQHCDNDCFIMREGEAIECNTVEKIGDKYIYSPERCKLGCPASHLDALEQLEVRGKKYNVPSKVDEFLKGWYGNWRTPSNTKPKSF